MASVAEPPRDDEPGPLVELTVYSDDSRASGHLALSADRVTDLLNEHDEFTFVDLSVQSLDDGREVSLHDVVAMRAEMCAVAVSGPQGNARRRARTRPCPVEIRLGQYDVSGSLHALPGPNPLAGFFGRHQIMVPLTEATIAYDSPAGRVLWRHETLLVNRLLVDQIAPAWHSDVRPPGLAPELLGQCLEEDVAEHMPPS
jgi:hypothetical protein